uniref:SRCR domain-containing protein n=1 Tax=Sphaeramia orbicularis TaxID=375764 RepID=A0A672Y8K6_9TELE
MLFLIGVQIRLVGSGSTRCSGRVEVYHNGVWGTVCDDDWDFNDTQVVCRQLGCDTRDIVPFTPRFGEGTGQIWLDDVSCLGNESSLTDCQHKGFGNHDCSHTEDVSVACSGKMTFGYSSDIRLAGSGSTQCSGRVQVSQNGTWGTVCDDDWDLNDAQVVCRQLGCGSALSAHPSAHFGQGSGPVWLTDVRCSGHEQYLVQCEHGGLGRRHCGHDKDVGVVCEDVQIKLVGPGSTQCSGRVEVYYNGTWGRVCNLYWGFSDAQVVCRQMGCETAQAVSAAGQFGEGTGPVWLDDVRCSGKESSLTECPHHKSETHDCEYGKDFGVVCSGKKTFCSDIVCFSKPFYQFNNSVIQLTLFISLFIGPSPVLSILCSHKLLPTDDSCQSLYTCSQKSPHQLFPCFLCLRLSSQTGRVWFYSVFWKS